jgi:hypothetical protein
VRKISPPTGIRSPVRPAVSELLNRLRYIGPPTASRALILSPVHLWARMDAMEKRNYRQSNPGSFIAGAVAIPSPTPLLYWSESSAVRDISPLDLQPWLLDMSSSRVWWSSAMSRFVSSLRASCARYGRNDRNSCHWLKHRELNRLGNLTVADGLVAVAVTPVLHCTCKGWGFVTSYSSADRCQGFEEACFLLLHDAVLNVHTPWPPDDDHQWSKRGSYCYQWQVDLCWRFYQDVFETKVAWKLVKFS